MTDHLESATRLYLVQEIERLRVERDRYRAALTELSEMAFSSMAMAAIAGDALRGAP